MNIWTLWAAFMGLSTGLWVGSTLEVLGGRWVPSAAWGAYLVGMVFLLTGVS